MRVLRWTPLLLLLLLIPALAHAATVNVSAGGANNVFTPSTITVTVGDTVTFTNAGGNHNVHFDGQTRLTPPTTNVGASLGSRTFTAAGSYHYVCDIHASVGMQGTVNVNPAPATTPTPTASATPAPGTTPTATPGPGGSATPGSGASATPTPTSGPTTNGTPAAAIGRVAHKVRKGRVRGAVTVEPSGRAYTVTVAVRGKRAGRAAGTSTGTSQRFAVRLSKAARKRIAHKGKLRATVIVRSGDVTAKRTVTLR